MSSNVNGRREKAKDWGSEKFCNYTDILSLFFFTSLPVLKLLDKTEVVEEL
jgi:hypothetical protein